MSVRLGHTYTSGMASPIPWVLLAFLSGLLFGSFANVLIARLPLRQSIVTPRSRCPGCSHPIRWFDNLPLLSFALLRGRCRDCGARIPWRYPAVELACGLWFLAAATQAFAHMSRQRPLDLLPTLSSDRSLVLSVIALCALGVLLIALLVIDWQHHLLPDTLTLSGILLGLLFTCSQAALLPTGAYDIHFSPHRKLRLNSPGSFAARGDVFLTGTEHMIYGRVVAILAAALILLLIRWIYQFIRHREGLGLGDAKLLGMIAAFLGFWPAVLSLFAGILAATAYATVLLARRRAHAGTALPFGSFLAIGGLLAGLFGRPLIAWYTSLLS